MAKRSKEEWEEERKKELLRTLRRGPDFDRFIDEQKDHPFKVLDDEKMHELVESIMLNGVLVPVTVRPLEDGEYEMISGHRRLFAVKEIGLERIPAIVKKYDDEPFRHWSEGGSVYILSDMHFADSDCKLMDPNWITPEEQVEIINSMVGKGDTFVCLGVVGDPKYVPMIKARKKILLLGNHDARGAYKDLFSEVYAGPLFISDKILLSHEPVFGLTWCLNIHGHDHNNTEAYKDGCKHINLAANVCGYTPINLGKIIKDGILSDIESIHRVTIDRAVERKLKSLDFN